jgi:hypothetical protein
LRFVLTGFSFLRRVQESFAWSEIAARPTFLDRVVLKAEDVDRLGGRVSPPLFLPIIAKKKRQKPPIGLVYRFKNR